jgi:hypothetical protein
MNKKQREAIARGLRAVDIRPANEDQFRRPTLQGGFDIFSRVGSSQTEERQDSTLPSDSTSLPPTLDPRRDVLTPDGRGSEVTPDRQEPLTPDGERLPPTLGEGLPPTPQKKQQNQLTSDRQGELLIPLTPDILLSPLQWRVLQILRELELSSEIPSYRDIGARVSSTREGVKSAVEVLRKVGAILEFEVVRTAKTQGVRFRLNHKMRFQEISLGKSKGLARRDANLPLTVRGRRQVSSTSMYVDKTYIRELLQILPVEWQIREQTLRQIVELCPTMGRLEFRRSLLYLVEQAKAGPEVKNHNAWLKGAFERTGGPIVTEAMIEAQLNRRPVLSVKAPALEKDGDAEEAEILRSYLTASAEEKLQIDQAAEERIGRLLATISSDKHDDIRTQARLECAREFFKKT